MQEIQAKVTEHDYAIKDMAKAIHELAETSKDSNIKLGEIAKSMGKQEVILEKLTNLEGNTKDSINRVHKRIDDLEEGLKEAKKRGEGDGCTALKVLKEQEKVGDTEMNSRIKSMQHRLDVADKHKWWVVTLVIGGFITALMNMILK